jgi:lipid II:glycine glycyltransferase (peptidoglycan interpeptide bridge formation enzyme)
MNITVKEISEQKTWDSFHQRHKNRYYLQTWEWGNFSAEFMQRKVFRLGFYDKDSTLIGIALCIEQQNRFGNYIYCPRGPIADWGDLNSFEDLLQSMITFFKSKSYDFIRVDPAILRDDKEAYNLFKKLGFKDGVYVTQVERAAMIDLQEKSEEELLASMRESNRYNIGKVGRKGVKVRRSEDVEDIDIFYDMLDELSDKKSFGIGSREYYKNHFSYLVRSGMVSLFISEYEDEPVAAGFVITYGREASYLFASSSRKNGKLRAPYLQVWEAIRYAKEIGLERMNLWGVVEEKNYKEGYPGYGYSNFKRGFGCYIEEYIKYQDYPINQLKYSLFRLQEKYRRYKDNSN